MTNEVERETALLTLVTEWTQGDLRSPRLRAHLADVYGIETSLGVELTKDPELAMLWANELTEGLGRAAIIQQVARNMVGTDPASALALNQQLPGSDRQQFFNALFGDWAFKDTEAALRWADQFSDPADHDAILQAIRASAPVGIGAQLQIKDGYPAVGVLVPGSPAQLGGQLQPGDRILALAQSDSAFVNMQNIALADVVQMIRGEPGTALQLQVLGADAPPNSPPRTIVIFRDQIKLRN